MTNFTVDQALDAIRARFGPGLSNGVCTILVHRELPDTFDASAWADWQFKPAAAAFDYAYDAGFITPYKLSGKWQMTPFGKQVAARVIAELEARA